MGAAAYEAVGVGPHILVVEDDPELCEFMARYLGDFDLRVSCAPDGKSMRNALAKSVVDLVLLDTAGRNPRDAGQMRQLSDVLDRVRPDETHVVIGSASATASAMTACELFARAGAGSLILTKLDEVAALGGLWPLVGNRSLPVSYLAAGQTVPHDLEPASRQRLAERIAGAAIVRGALGN